MAAVSFASRKAGRKRLTFLEDLVEVALELDPQVGLPVLNEIASAV